MKHKKEKMEKHMETIKSFIQQMNGKNIKI